MAPDIEQQPNINSKDDLTGLSEVESIETGQVLRSTFYHIDSNETVWFGKFHGVRKNDLTVEDLKQHVERIPDWKVYPLKTSTITAFPREDIGEEHYLKRPRAFCLDDEEESKLLPEIFIGEAETLEFLRQHPHPNIVPYYGSTLKDDRVTALVLKKYPATLQYRYEDDARDFDPQKCLRGLWAGVRHLHSLSMAHNDINPTNIALDNDDNAVIIDFGSCKEIGVPLVSAGTYGWLAEGELYEVSSKIHDEAAIGLIETWLQTKESERAEERASQDKSEEASHNHQPALSLALPSG